jgi:hypothetical protein
LPECYLGDQRDKQSNLWGLADLPSKARAALAREGEPEDTLGETTALRMDGRMTRMNHDGANRRAKARGAPRARDTGIGRSHGFLGSAYFSTESAPYACLGCHKYFSREELDPHDGYCVVNGCAWTEEDETARQEAVARARVLNAAREQLWAAEQPQMGTLEPPDAQTGMPDAPETVRGPAKARAFLRRAKAVHIPLKFPPF